MTDLIIIGAGGLGREIATMISSSSLSAEYRILGFVDDGIREKTQVSRWSVLGSIQTLADYPSGSSVVLALGDPKVKQAIVDRIEHLGLRYPTLIHPTVHIGDPATVRIGEGCVLCPGVALTTEIEIGRYALFNLNSTVGHNVAVGDFASLMPGAHISGNVHIGAQSMIGTGACVLQNCSIGTGAKVGAGAVVTGTVADNTTVVGVPARTPS